MVWSGPGTEVNDSSCIDCGLNHVIITYDPLDHRRCPGLLEKKLTPEGALNMYIYRTKVENM